MLTVARVLAIPALIAVWFSPLPNASLVCTLTFVLASLTDFLDGYLARRWHATTPFGAFLDPVADKLMVAAVLILLASESISWLIPTAAWVIISREIGVIALREWAAASGSGAHEAVAVNWVGKCKTATQVG